MAAGGGGRHRVVQHSAVCGGVLHHGAAHVVRELEVLLVHHLVHGHVAIRPGGGGRVDLSERTVSEAAIKRPFYDHQHL